MIFPVLNQAHQLIMTNKKEHPDFKKKFEECNDKFQKIFKLTSVASKVINADLKILKVNQALTELLGFSAEEIEGSEILDYACEEYKHHWSHLQDELWNKETPFFKLDACLLKKDKSLVWVKVTTILFKEDGETYGFSVLDNITGLKHFEESEKRLSLALQYSNMAAWEMNLIDHSVIRSENHDQIFGYKEPLKTWNRDTYLQHLLPDDAAHFEKAFQFLKNGSSFDFKGRIHSKEVGLKWIHFQGEAELDKLGNNSKIIGTIKDITMDKLLERQKDDFISVASHELKTPVTSLNASLQLLNKMVKNTGDKLPQLVSQANKSMTKISTLIEDLLSATSISEGQMHLNKSTFLISQMIDDCCNHILLPGKNSLKTYGDVGLKVHADPERIAQVIVNLVKNAIKYGPESDDIRIDVEKVNGMAKISVTDEGPGIPSEKIPHLFDRFYRVDKDGSRTSGMGLGLYISAEIIKRHGGEIGADSEKGKGSTFWFTLPLE
jgi:PAS domain S-box-containing protein